MYAGAAESLHRTAMDTGFEDAARADDLQREREASEELVSFRGVVDDDEEEGKDVKTDVKPMLKLSYKGTLSPSLPALTNPFKGFSIASRHLVLIIEPYPATHFPAPKSARARSTYSRSMSRATAVERETTGPSSATSFRGETPLVPNSRRGGTGSTRPTPTPFMNDRQTPIPNSRTGGRIQSTTPLFRDMTPMSAFGDAAPSRGPALFNDGEGSSDEEETQWRREVRQGSYAPWRGASVAAEGGDEAAPSSGRRRVTDSDDSDDIDDEDEGDDGEDDDDDAEVAQARRLMALSQRLQGNTEGRTGASGGGTAVDAGELGGGDEDDAYGEGDDGFGQDVGGADA